MTIDWSTALWRAASCVTCASASRPGTTRPISAAPGYLLNLGETPYLEAWELQRALAGAVSQDAIPDTVVMLEHPPVITLGRRTDGEELHVPDNAEVE